MVLPIIIIVAVVVAVVATVVAVLATPHSLAPVLVFLLLPFRPGTVKKQLLCYTKNQTPLCHTKNKCQNHRREELRY